MLDACLRPWIDGPLTAAGRGLAARGVTADGLTLAAFVVGLLAVPALAAGWFAVALGLILLNRVLDGLDGAVARATRPTDWGAYLDIVCDFAFYGAVPLGFALADPAVNALPAAALLLSFIGTGSTFLAHAILAERHGLTTRARGRKSMYHLGGLMEGTETIVFLVAFCLWPTGFPVLAWIMAGLCVVSAMGRVLLTARTFRGA
ncbi:CDP-alcohol phosphatidyltransferase family protein [Roseospira visakhapatnamensis]|uniref:Phosphatidylglycerophosphate synthase n=1 Tax=Roseospira visakhapatnamensis TaxID=390880 RepID=A0A7W6RB61_9PROT|nr:CDP-alcohol phosphatidyltransferase family protein [Roseospira visakhapatnamensis]MBB4265283.1 phosphatidylglycerophosphate synthase [Roseospira visakhapatnamensis]